MAAIQASRLRSVSAMQCPKCQQEVKEDSQYCLGCGEKVGLKCFECGKIVPLTATFCDRCGHGWTLTGIASRGASKAKKKRTEGDWDGDARTGRVEEARTLSKGSSALVSEPPMGARTKIFLFVAIFYAVLLTYLAVVFLAPSSQLGRMATLFQNFWLNFIILGLAIFFATVVLFFLLWSFWARFGKTRWGHPRLGELLVTDGYITKKQLKDALAEQELRMGEVLVEAGRVAREQLREALALQKKSPAQRLGDILKEKGYAGEDDVFWALGKTQRKLGEILQEKRLVSEYDLDWVLAKQEHSSRR